MRVNESVERVSVKLRTVAAAVLFVGATTATDTVAQSSAATFTPGSREIYALDLSATNGSEVPKALRTLSGKLSVVTKDGVRMLKAAEPSEFLVSLPETLSSEFTLEFEIIPKACCNPSDLMFEGTATMSRSATSAQVSWHPQTIIVVGGGEYFQTPMPSELAEVLPSAPTQVAASFQSGGLTLFTNGRQVASLPNRAFARGRVLRVFLGGQDEDQHAVYLSKLRIAAGGGTVATAQNQSALTGSGTGGTIASPSGPSSSPAIPSSPATGTGSVRTSSTITATAATAGAATPTAPSPAGPQETAAGIGTSMGIARALVMWTPVRDAISYGVYRMATASSAGVLYATISATDAASADSVVGKLAAIDLDPGDTYWVDAVFANGTRSDPGPIAKATVPTQVPTSLSAPRVPNLKAVVGGTTTVTLIDGQRVRGNKITWSWDQFPDTSTYVYWTSVEIWDVAPSQSTLLPKPRLYHTERIRIPDAVPPIVIMNDGGTPGPPYSMSFAAGNGVRFCVAQFPIAQLVSTTDISTQNVSCVTSQLPP